MKQVIIDMQGFKRDSQFIPKEVVVLFNEDEYFRFLIRPPCEFCELTRKQQNNVKWLTENFHDLEWMDGTVTYKSVQSFILANVSKNTIVYVKGLEKSRWVEEFLKDEVCVETIDDNITLKKLKEKFPNVKRCAGHSLTCALENVFLIRNYLKYDCE
ncbi:hypothetical protein Zmor_023079 [Zophobas morio]|uniref:Uncharacterized protein n=1 Tax=Zophobas morio TaxID=2755281 RepID=A0AA38HX92_9CUCU|nr:hypothetical protein Zmor_023079 [Zophobas morio]